MKKIGVLGAGAWGTAIAQTLAYNGYEVGLWCYEQQVADSIKNARENKQYLPGTALDLKVFPTISLAQAVKEAHIIFEAIPVRFMRTVLKNAQQHIASNQILVVLSKGIEQGTLLFPTQIVADIFGKQHPCAVISGPSYAHDLARKAITGVMIADNKKNEAMTLVQRILENEFLKIYPSNDTIGLQIGGALKNIIALAVGMLEGAEYTDNTQSFFITKGLAEMAALSEKMHAFPETIYGLAGVGDLILTSLGKYSKNKEFGRQLGKGQTFDAVVKKMGIAPEGVSAADSVAQLVQKFDLKNSLFLIIHETIQQRKTSQDLVSFLLQ